MALTPEQRASIVELWHSFHAQLPPIADARRQLHAAIAATIPSGLEARELAVQYLKVSGPPCFGRALVVSATEVMRTQSMWADQQRAIRR